MHKGISSKVPINESATRRGRLSPYRATIFKKSASSSRFFIAHCRVRMTSVVPAFHAVGNIESAVSRLVFLSPRSVAFALALSRRFLP